MLPAIDNWTSIPVCHLPQHQEQSFKIITHMLLSLCNGLENAILSYTPHNPSAHLSDCTWHHTSSGCLKHVCLLSGRLVLQVHFSFWESLHSVLEQGSWNTYYGGAVSHQNTDALVAFWDSQACSRAHNSSLPTSTLPSLISSCFIVKKLTNKLGVMAHAINYRTQELDHLCEFEIGVPFCYFLQWK